MTMPTSEEAPQMDAIVRDFHAHIYFDPQQVDQARALASAAQARFEVAIGRFHLTPVGPHPRGSCQITVQCEDFGRFACWLALFRNGLTMFAHPNTGDDWIDHTAHMIWFEPSETLAPAFFAALSARGLAPQAIPSA